MSLVFPGKCTFFWSEYLLYHNDTGYSSFAQSARKWGCLQGRNAHKRGIYVLDMFPVGTALKTDGGVHASEPVAATWSIQATDLTAASVYNADITLCDKKGGN